MLLGEAMLVSAAGGALGFLLGVRRGAHPWRHVRQRRAVPVLLFLVAIALSLALALAGTVGPLRLALRIDPARVLRV